jgi:hypothetical protein
MRKDVVDVLVGDRSKSGSTGLINRRVTKRLGCLARGAADIIDKPYFAGIDYQRLLCREVKAPYKPRVDASGIDQKNFDPIEETVPIEEYEFEQSIFENF